MSDPYFDNPALSRSDIVALRRGPNYWKYWKDEKKSSKAMDFGTAFHMAILEPHRFRQSYAVAPEGLSFVTKEGKAWKADNAHKSILKSDDFSMLQEMAANVLTHSWCSFKFKDSTCEQNYFFNHEETGEPLKAKPDLVNLKEGCIVDFKTTRTLNERKLGYESIDRGYDIQAFMCQHAVMRKTGLELPFYNVFIEKFPPYDILIVEYTQEDIYRAEAKVHETLLIYQECKKNDLWPSIKPKEPIRLILGVVESEDIEENEETTSF